MTAIITMPPIDSAAKMFMTLDNAHTSGGIKMMMATTTTQVGQCCCVVKGILSSSGPE